MKSVQNGGVINSAVGSGSGGGAGERAKTHHHHKKSKYKHLKMRTIATDYLISIPLNSSSAPQDNLSSLSSSSSTAATATTTTTPMLRGNKPYFEKLLSNDFDCFLSLNKINSRPDQQTEFFKYYKQKCINERLNAAYNNSDANNKHDSRLDEFLRSEFEEQQQQQLTVRNYVEDILANKNKIVENKKINKKKEFTVVPSILVGESNEVSVPAAAINQANKIAGQIDEQRSLSNENLTNAITASASASSGSLLHRKSSRKVSKSPSELPTIDSLSNMSMNRATGSHTQIAGDMNQSKYSFIAKTNNFGINSCIAVAATASSTTVPVAVVVNQQTQQQLQQQSLLVSMGSGATTTSATNKNNVKRTISESSTESNYNTVNSITSINNRNLLSIAAGSSTTSKLKPTIYHSLKRLTNEKLFFTANSTPLGIFSRLPFASNLANNNKSQANESFINSRPRHMSANKSIQPSQNYSFIYDVFELLDLDIDEYSKWGEMSYSNLIDPVTLQNRRSLFRRANTIDENQMTTKLNFFKDFNVDQTCEKIDEAHEGILSLEKDDDQKFTSLGAAAVFKKETSPSHFNHPYHSDYLDDPQLTEMTAGKNRTCLKFASYAVSIIDYVKPLDLKKEINETFKEKFPHIQISLTKLRSIKRELVEIAFESSLDSIIVAQAYIYFEKLILQGLINKSNRKYLAANCLILAAKLNDSTKKDISKLIDTIIDKFRFDSKKELISYEFAILVALEFNLIVKYDTDFINHYERLINSSHFKKLTEQNSSVNPVVSVSASNNNSHNRTNYD